jgi:hypothetical protein
VVLDRSDVHEKFESEKIAHLNFNSWMEFCFRILVVVISNSVDFMQNIRKRQ